MNIEDDPSTGLNGALARTINTQRVAKKLTMDALGEKAGVPERTLVRYINGQRHIQVAALERLAGALGMTASRLLRAAEKTIKETE